MTATTTDPLVTKACQTIRTRATEEGQSTAWMLMKANEVINVLGTFLPRKQVIEEVAELLGFGIADITNGRA